MYEQWKRLESERVPEVKFPTRVTADGMRKAFRKEILSLSPDSANFGDEIAKSLRDYIGNSTKIHLSPTETVDQWKSRLPELLGDVFERIRDIRYAPKG